eukprot:TRINITY_DN75061_c0_g1_i1.p1 TRINITY_DN75061_c0_g1~~TRINITY_DN75061_c0_g1_i1.p1  ORF type:complete len:381 (-),score=33.28 TRINITY_DN75061_c0_g1_i1:51-1193(-)
MRKVSTAPVEFFVSLNGVELIGIDIVAQNFTARGFITIIWKDAKLPKKAADVGCPLPNDGSDSVYHGNYCLADDGYIMPLNPQSVFVNAVEYHLESSGIAYDVESGGVAQSLGWCGTFEQSIWLDRFPFERVHCEFVLKNQRKTFVLRGYELEWISQSKLEVWDDQKDILSLRLSPQVAQEYDLHSLCLEMFSKANTKDVLSQPRIIARLQRKPNFYIWSMILPCFIFGLITCISFVESIGSLSDRMSLNTTMLLTIVALKLMTSDSLPKIAYMTWLDYYFSSAMGFIVVVIICNVVSAEATLKSDDQKFKHDTDRALLIIFGSLWLVIHLIVMLGVRLTWWSHAWTYVASRQGAGSNQTNASKKLKLDHTMSPELTKTE